MTDLVGSRPDPSPEPGTEPFGPIGISADLFDELTEPGVM